MFFRDYNLKLNAQSIIVFFIAVLGIGLAGFIGFLSATISFWAMFSIIPLLILVLISAPKSSLSDNKFVSTLLFIAIFLSVLWPRYININLGAFPDLNPQRLIFSLVIFLWLYYWSVSQELRQTFWQSIEPHLLIFSLLVLFIFLGFVSIIPAVDPIGSLFGFFNSFISYFLVFFIVLSFWAKENMVSKLPKSILVTTGIVIIFGIYESLILKNIFIEYLPAGFHASTDVLENALADKLRNGVYRIQASFSHPLLYAEFLVMLIPLVYFAGKEGNSFIVKLMSYAMLFLIPYCIWKSGSRAALVIMCVLFFLIYLLVAFRNIRFKKSFSALTILFLATPILIIVFLSVGGDLLDLISGRNIQEYRSSAARMLMLERSIPLILESPFFGYGTNSAAVLLDITGGHGNYTIDSFYLSIVLESGIPALLTFFLLVSLIVLRGLKISLTTPNVDGLLTGLISLSILGFVVFRFVLSTPHNLFYFFILVGLYMIISNKAINSTLHNGKETQ